MKIEEIGKLGAKIIAFTIYQYYQYYGIAKNTTNKLQKLNIHIENHRRNKQKECYYVDHG